MTFLRHSIKFSRVCICLFYIHTHTHTQTSLFLYSYLPGKLRDTASLVTATISATGILAKSGSITIDIAFYCIFLGMSKTRIFRITRYSASRDRDLSLPRFLFSSLPFSLFLFLSFDEGEKKTARRGYRRDRSFRAAPSRN